MNKPETFLLHRGGRTEQMVLRREYDAVVTELNKLKAAKDETARIKRAKVLMSKVLDSKISGYLHGKIINGMKGFIQDE